MRYLVFIYTTYYPAGGLLDLDSTFDNLEEAKNKLSIELEKEWGYGHGHIFDIVDRKVYDVNNEDITTEFKDLK